MTEKIKITFLGTSSAIPTAERNHTAILLTYQGENILVDCGEGTQRQFRKAKINPGKITRLLITHWHGDHVLGIPGLLQTLAFNGYKKKLYIYGPKGTKKFMKNLLNTFVFAGKISLEIKEIGNGKFFETNDFYLEAKAMTHGTVCYAYSFVKKGQIRIDKKKLQKLKIPPGKHLQKLKQGKNIVYKKKKYLAKNLTFAEGDKKISFVLDTSNNRKIVPFVKDSDLLVCEASFGSESNQRAKEYGHLTSRQAAEIAKKAKVKKLILTHITQRYGNKFSKILNQAKKTFKNSYVPKDLDKVEV